MQYIEVSEIVSIVGGKDVAIDIGYTIANLYIHTYWEHGLIMSNISYCR